MDISVFKTEVESCSNRYIKKLNKYFTTEDLKQEMYLKLHIVSYKFDDIPYEEDQRRLAYTICRCMCIDLIRKYELAGIILYCDQEDLINMAGGITEYLKQIEYNNLRLDIKKWSQNKPQHIKLITKELLCSDEFPEHSVMAKKLGVSVRSVIRYYNTTRESLQKYLEFQCRA